MTAPAPFVLTHEEEIDWLALRLVPGLGTRNAGKLLQRLRTPRAIFQASRSELEGLGISGTVAQSIASGCSYDEAVTQQERLRAADAVVIPLSHPDYPDALREIYDPPVVLFARGRVGLLHTAMLGIVGTRRPTRYGLAVAEKMATDLALASLTIVSGMARGVDTAAHRGALSAQGNTVAVFGCGADVIYPSENRRLADDIAARGLILSEFPMGSTAFPQNFPIRNRIISGMSAGTLVIEGAQYSGSTITARLALEQGKEVFAIPGNITSPQSWGPNLLLKQGAHLVQDWNDVIEALPSEVRRRVFTARGVREEPKQADLPLDAPGSNLSRWILGQLRVDANTSLDDLLDRADHTSPSEVLAALFEMEMMGQVRQLPGKNFVKVWSS